MHLPRWLSLFTLSLVLLVTGCGPSENGGDTNQQASDESSSQKKAAWSYEGDTGPEHWADLSDAYAACNGTRQSPVDLTNASAGEEPPLQTNYASAEAEVTDTGHAIQVNTTGGTLKVGDRSYDLLQFHVHTPSEHVVNGTRYPGEIHLVHQAGENQLAVLALFVDEGSGSNPALHDWIQGTDTTLTYDPSALLPAPRSYYTYEGSLTTPPCSEIVRWVVLETPIQASSAQLDTLRAQYEGNARPLQPLNDRTIQHVSAE